jgi:hypothetical protein
VGKDLRRAAGKGFISPYAFYVGLGQVKASVGHEPKPIKSQGLVVLFFGKPVMGETLSRGIGQLALQAYQNHDTSFAQNPYRTTLL